MAMTSRIAAGLGAYDEQSYTHPCSGSISVSLRSCMVSWCRRAAFVLTLHMGPMKIHYAVIAIPGNAGWIPTNGKGWSSGCCCSAV